MNHPEMSVVLVTPDRYATIRRTVACLRAQTLRDRLELVIVAPSAGDLQLDESEFKEFFRFVIVEVGEIKSIGAANAVGVRNATAPVVALAEDHVFPHPNWAEALIRAHQQEWAAVGPEVANANPNSLISWADFLLGYGPWMEPASAGTVQHLPGHNSSYKRSHLLAYGPQLDNMMEAETILHWDMRTKGYKLYLEPKAKIRHMNFGLLRSWIPAQFYSSRLFAAVRSQSWSAFQRLTYTCAGPLIAVVRFKRMLPYFKHLQLDVMPPLLLGLAVSALGEMTGYAFGTGNARKQLTRFEFHRVQHVAHRR